MTHSDVETLFHEFGHALHSIVTRAKYRSLCRNECARRFRRSAVANVAELGLGQKVLDTFAADYRDPSKKSRPRSFRR